MWVWVWVWEGGVGLEVVEDLWGDGLLGEGLLEEREMEKGFLVGGGAWVEAEGMVVVLVWMWGLVREERLC